MKEVIKELIESGCSILDIINELRELAPDEKIRCASCNSRLCDLDDGYIVIKCRCGEIAKIT